LQRNIRKKGGDSEKMSEFIEDSTEKMSDSSEKTGSDSEQIAELIPEQIRFRGQRGPDKSTRRFNQNSLRNLKQYQNNTLTEKTNDSDKWIWIVVGIIVAVIVGILIWRIHDWWKEKQ